MINLYTKFCVLLIFCSFVSSVLIAQDVGNNKLLKKNQTTFMEEWKLTPAEVATCQNLPKTIRPTITNEGTEQLEITKMSICNDYNNIGSINDFKILVNLPIVLNPGETLEMPVLINPSSTYNHAVFQLKVETNSLRKTHDKVDLTVTATFDKFSSKAKAVIKDNMPGIDLGTNEAVKYTVILNREKIIPDATIPSFKVEVTYGLDFLGLSFNDAAKTPILAKIEPSSQLIAAGYSMIAPIERKVNTKTNTETITMTFVGTEPLFKAAGEIELVSITFDALPPYYQSIDENKNMKGRTTSICHEILTLDDCVKIKGDCAKININDSKYNLQDVSPNPVGSDGGYIKFGVDNSDVINVIKIYDSNGLLISTVFSGKLNIGEYKIRIPVEKLGIGVYFVEMTAGSFKEIKKFIFQK